MLNIGLSASPNLVVVNATWEPPSKGIKRAKTTKGEPGTPKAALKRKPKTDRGISGIKGDPARTRIKQPGAEKGKPQAA